MLVVSGALHRGNWSDALGLLAWLLTIRVFRWPSAWENPLDFSSQSIVDFMKKDMATPLRLCFVEDNAALREELMFGLRHLGFQVDGYASAEAFYRAMVGAEWDIILIDVGLPGEDGFSLATHLRLSVRADRLGLVMLTARQAIEDRRQGSAVADLYFVKPVDLVELGAALSNLGRRLRAAQRVDPVGPALGASESNAWRLTDDGWTLVAPTAQRLALTAQERQFVGVLMAGSGKPISREVIVSALGGDPYDYDFHRLDTLVSRLRKKVQAQGLDFPLRSVRGVGYLFRA